MVEKIYIKLLDEGVDSWLPTFGEKISDNIYKVLATENYDPDCEEWEFVPNTLVYCELQEKDIGRGSRQKVLIAIHEASA